RSASQGRVARSCSTVPGQHESVQRLASASNIPASRGHVRDQFCGTSASSARDHANRSGRSRSCAIARHLVPCWAQACCARRRDPAPTSRGDLMAHQHPPRFLKIVDDAKTRVRETNVDAVKTRMDRGDKFVLVDVREESEFAKDHLPGAIHLGKGIIERDIEARVPELNTEMILYCGGGFRSALAADNLQKMGYTNVISMDGGIRGWREKGYPLTKN